MQRTFWIIVSVAVLSAVVVLGAGCRKNSPAPGGSDAAACACCSDKKAGHTAYHGGSLNAIETCAVGHAEIKLEGDTLKCWLVGGENETGKAVRVSDPEIVLTVKTGDGQQQTLALKAKPLELAGEKVGDCSYFDGQASWLNGLKKFDATGKVNFKGKERPVKIEFPEGYDPD
jgi:hypothetical protein